MAEAAAAAGVPLVLSSNAGSTFADIGATGATWWLQLYMTPTASVRPGWSTQAVAHGATRGGADRRHPGGRHEATPPPGGRGCGTSRTPRGSGPTCPARTVRPTPRAAPRRWTWGRGPRLAAPSAPGVPVVVKGVLRGDDAAEAVAAGAAGVWVSNHGGRQLDQARPRRGAWPGCGPPSGGGPTVLVDGGVRSGPPRPGGLALGADAVFVGRPLFHRAGGRRAGRRTPGPGAAARRAGGVDAPGRVRRPRGRAGDRRRRSRGHVDQRGPVRGPQGRLTSVTRPVTGATTARFDPGPAGS